MKYQLSLLFLILCLLPGCFEENDPEIINITGEWQGTATWLYLSDPDFTFSLTMEASFIQTGSVVTGSWVLSFAGDQIANGIFTYTSNYGNRINGIMDGEGAFYQSPEFTASISDSTMNGFGAGQDVDAHDTFEIAFTLNKIN